MLSLFKSDPVKKLKKKHAELLEQALHAQRNGDIHKYSFLTKEAEDIYEEIDALEKSQQT